MRPKVRVGLLFGGRSGEHEVSIASATSVLGALDPERYEAVAIGITRQGQWLIADEPDSLLEAEVTLELPDTVEAVPDVTHRAIVRVNERGGLSNHETAVDVIFPLLHGPFGEDGTVQGLLELADLPYVGSGVLGSAVSMDKATMKALFEQAGLPSVAHVLVARSAWRRDRALTIERIESAFPYPVFVKPCNLGSSVGINKAADRAQLETALDIAAAYDRRVIVEEGIDGREVECAVLGNDEPMPSVVGEIVSHHEFYDYEAKYTDGLADLIIPARLDGEQVRTVQELAIRAFNAVDAAGLARVDFFVRRADGEVVVNEINTMPGFTRTSMYPKLWEASGLPYAELVDRLIQLGLERHADTSERRTSR
jgi:D-alanine-D-alanine ligase